MSRQLQRVVITGVGAITPIGNTATEFWNGMMEGRSGTVPITRFDATEFDTRFAAEVKNYDPTIHITRKEVQRMDLFSQLAMSAAIMAVEHSGIDFEKTNRERIGVVFGSGIGGMWTYHHQQQNLYDRGGKPDRISPFFVPMLISDIAAGHIAIRYGLKGPNYGTVSACATSSHSIADALMLMQRGMADVMLAGGSEAVICPMGIGGFNAMKALSTRNDDPATASRPFDKDRDGFVLAEGAGVVVLEELEHARKRGARIYGELMGYGASGDAGHITQPDEEGRGAARAMAMALTDAGLNPDAVHYVNAHGTSTPLGDKAETIAIKRVFADHAKRLTISSTKSQLGHTLGASGGIELVVCALTIARGVIAPTVNLDHPDPDCDLDYTPNIARAANVEIAMSNSFGFGGHNASLILSRLR